MVRVAVPAVWPERDDDVRLKVVDDRSRRCGNVGQRLLREPTVAEVQAGDVVDPEGVAEASSSLTRMAPSTRLVAVAASRIWPASPCVRDTIAVTAPAPAHRAIVPPTQKTSSSGWANSPRTRGALPPVTAEPHKVASSAWLPFENSLIGGSVPTPGTRNRPPLTRTSHRLELPRLDGWAGGAAVPPDDGTSGTEAQAPPGSLHLAQREASSALPPGVVGRSVAPAVPVHAVPTTPAVAAQPVPTPEAVAPASALCGSRPSEAAPDGRLPWMEQLQCEAAA